MKKNPGNNSVHRNGIYECLYIGGDTDLHSGNTAKTCGRK